MWCLLRLPVCSWIVGVVSVLLGCNNALHPTEPSDVLAVSERASEYSPKVGVPASVRSAIPLAAGPTFIDVRGVGDSAWSSVRAARAPESRFKAALSSFDPTGKILKGDLNFINWEASVGERCDAYFPVDFAFLSRPAAIADAFSHGFNLFGLANNHSEDCVSGPDPDGAKVPGAVASARFMKKFSHRKPMVWHGVGPSSSLKTPSILTFSLKGRSVKVVFASVAFQDWECVESACEPIVVALLSKMKASSADLRVLSVHSQGDAAFDRGKVWAEKFVREFDGDIVFAHGPHTWAGVKVINKSAGGGQGVVFHGLGNFLHNQVMPNPDNMIGRVLLNAATLDPVQIQVIPVVNNQGGDNVILASEAKGLPLANVVWTRARLKAHRDVPVGFSNVK